MQSASDFSTITDKGQHLQGSGVPEVTPVKESKVDFAVHTSDQGGLKELTLDLRKGRSNLSPIVQMGPPQAMQVLDRESRS